MATIDQYRFLKAALEDIRLASDLTTQDLGTSRHVVVLLHDALEFILYEALQVLSEDIYKNGQNTIGLDAAIAMCKAKSIDLPLPGTIRTIQKHRGDAKHHAQTPDNAAFSRMLAGFRVVSSRLIHERFGQALGDELKKLGLLPYHVALYDSYRHFRTHNWTAALRFALAALLHKHRAILGDPDDFAGGTLEVPALMRLVTAEMTAASYPGAPKDAVNGLKALPNEATRVIRAGGYSASCGGWWTRLRIPRRYHTRNLRRQGRAVVYRTISPAEPVFL